MKAQFKPGDKVRCVIPIQSPGKSPHLIEGEIYTVKDTLPGGTYPRVSLIETKGYFYGERFELFVEPSPAEMCETLQAFFKRILQEPKITVGCRVLDISNPKISTYIVVAEPRSGYVELMVPLWSEEVKCFTSRTLSVLKYVDKGERN